MTGYASAQLSLGAAPAGAEGGKPTTTGRLGLEIRSVNSRFLDLSFRLGEELRAYEPQLRELLTGRLKEPYAAGVTVDGNVTLDDLRRVFPGY